MGLSETANLAVRIGLDDKLTPGLAKANTSLSRFNTGIGKAGKGVGQLAGGVAKAGAKIAGLGAIVLTGVAAAAIEFEDAFAGVKKTLDETQLAAEGLTFKDLERQFRDMATVIPVAAADLARIGEAAGALGIKAGDISEFTEVVAKLGVTTDLTTDEAAEALGKLGTILNLTGQDFEDFADTLVNLGNNGASTESAIIEVTKRFAAAATTAGLATNDILALSSAISSLGLEPYAAGGALSRLFNNMGTNIALANDKGKAFSQLIGKPIKDLQRDINQGKGLTLFMDVLKEIKGLKTTDQHKVLKALGITNTSDRNALILMSSNIKDVAAALDVAKNSTGALSEEATKRFDTIRSKLTLLKNNFLEAAFTIGGDPTNPKSFIGSIGVAAEKLSAFLKQPGNKRELEKFGETLGAAIAGIDFDKLLGAAKGVVKTLDPIIGALAKLADAIGKLPPELIGAGGTILVANHLSGGAIGAGIGNIVGGLGESLAKSLAARIPLFGSAFVQPVFVTNMAGGIGGAGGGPSIAGGGLTKIEKAFSLLAIASSALAVFVTQQEISANSTAQAGGLRDTLNSNLSLKTPEELTIALKGVNEGIHALESNPLTVLVRGDALDVLKSMRDSILKEQEKDSLVDFRAGERESAGGNQPAKVVNSIGRLERRLNAAIRQEARAERRGNDRNARQAGNKVDRLREKLNAKLNQVEGATKQSGRAIQGRVATSNGLLRRVAAKDLSVKVNVSNPVSVATFVNGMAVSTRYGGNTSVTAV